MNVPAPTLESRNRDAFLADLLAKLSGYLPDFGLQPGGAGDALAQIFSRYLEIYGEGLNGAPDRTLLAFLSQSGASLLAAQSARAALVFSLMPNSPVDVPLPANSQVAAPAKPRPVSPLLDEDEAAAGQPAAEPQAQIFATNQAVTLTRAQLAAVYTVDPGQDRFSDHTASLQGITQISAGTEAPVITFFAADTPVEHAIYLGHTEAFALAGEAEIRLNVVLGASSARNALRSLEIDWEYLSEDGWLPLKLDRDLTNGLNNDGVIILIKDCGPDAKEDTISGWTSYWLRGLLRTPLLPQGSGAGELPVLDTLQVRVGFTKTGLLPDQAYTNQAKVDLSNNFLPFGAQPARYTTFYLACKEAFQRRGARISLNFTFSEPGATSTAVLGWEYDTGNGWFPVDARYEFSDETKAMTQDGAVSFVTPPDWAESKINGEKNFWLRVRLDNGDYGQPMRLSVVPDGSSYKVTLVDSTLEPPVVSKFSVDYTYLTNAAKLDHCLTFNNFAYQDHSEDSRWLRRPFAPFEPLTERFASLYLGFNQPLPSGLISLYLHVGDENESQSLAGVLGLVWEYASQRGWTELSVLDETAGFRRSGMLQFIGPSDAVPLEGAGGLLYRVRARLKQGEALADRPVQGLWLNAAWATQRQFVENEVLGSSNGLAGQTLTFLRRAGPVLAGEVVEVREWVSPDVQAVGAGQGWQTAVLDVPAREVRLEHDPVSGAVKAAWVRWYERPHLFTSGPGDRHYLLERSSGLLRFGDGQRGMIPPAGCRIQATYSSGGGLQGNVPAGEIHELRTGAPYLMSVANPAPALGGADTEALPAVRERGPFRLRHLGRSLAAEDYAWLAREASPGVARARCLPLVGPDGGGMAGWVSVVIVPNTLDPLPLPDAELVRRVRDYLAAHAPAAIAGQVRVLPPELVPVSVAAEIVPRDPGQAARVEARVRRALEHYLHPLAGGPYGRGWDLGESVYLSQVSAVIEHTQGVDYARSVSLRVGATLYTNQVPVPETGLLVSGDHELKLLILTD